MVLVVVFPLIMPAPGALPRSAFAAVVAPGHGRTGPALRFVVPHLPRCAHHRTARVSSPPGRAVDGSDTGNRAIDFAAKAAGETGDSIVLAYVIEWSPYSFHTPEELAERHKRRESEISRAEQLMLAPAAAKISAKNIFLSARTRKLADPSSSIGTTPCCTFNPR